jgi:tetratricopeptide (TPR) repeat protein/tRNA A-37 threonylcarbamoyl transferase component Bud32
VDCPACHAPNPEEQALCGKCGASLGRPDAAGGGTTRLAPHSPDALESGSIFADRYQVIEELGRGGMGRVYKVIDKEVRAKVALKLIRPDIASDQATIDRFREELKTAREISHKNICRMYDLGRHGTTYFLTMEYVPGQDLKSMVAMSGQLGVGTAISIAKQVCEGLAEAHRIGVIHRDLKPQNIQIDRGGVAKIMDFGIARSVVAKGMTDAGVALGTPQYMSPEQMEAKGVDARADLYSLGIILYEMLTGRVPFDGDTPLAVAVKHKLDTPPDPRELNATIPPDLARLILKCLEKDKDVRCQSAAAVHADLVRIEQGLPTPAQVVPQQRPTTSKEITVRFTMRQVLVPALAVLVILAVALGAWRLWSRPAAAGVAPAGKPLLAVLYFENVSGDPALGTWRAGLPELLITSLSQSRLVNVVSSDTMFSVLRSLNLADAPRYSRDDLSEVAKASRAQYLLTGSVMKAGQSTVIMTRLQNAATGEVIRTGTIECQKDEEILSRVDELARGIKADLDLSPQAISSDIARPIGEILTASPEALRYYTEARRHHLNYSHQDALSLYQRAIDADPGFAMAYRGMGSIFQIFGDDARSAAMSQKALELSDRLPERLRNHIRMTAFFGSTTTYAELLDTCNQQLAKYPDDLFGLYYLSLVFDAMGEYQKSASLQESVVRADPSLLYADALSQSYSYLGDYPRARSTLDDYVARDPNDARGHTALGFLLLATGQFAEAQREVEVATLLEPRDPILDALKGDLALLRNEFSASEREYLAVIDHAKALFGRSASSSLASLYLTQGRFAKAREQWQAAQEADQGTRELWSGHADRAVTAFRTQLAGPAALQPDRALWFAAGLGLSYAATGDIDRALEAADTLKAIREGLFVKAKTQLGLLLSGAIASRRGAGPAAVADLERAVAMLPYQMSEASQHAVFLDTLAGAYAAAGDLTKARETYEKITTLTSGRHDYGAIYARSYYRLGLIATRQGDEARAREQFAKFLELWKNADAGLPEVADARKRMAQ